MFKQILAIIAAAVCAALVVIVPELGSESAMASTQSGQFGVPSREVVVEKEAQKSKSDCLQGWPYYEHTCLRDARVPNGAGRMVRVIAIDRIDSH
jgi:hypothetical protein